MHIILFDTNERNKLFPLTLTRAVADIRMGILTMKERWQKMTGAAVFVLTDTYLQALYGQIEKGNYYFINATIVPTPELLTAILALQNDSAIADQDGLIAGKAVINTSISASEIVNLFKNISSISAAKRIALPNEIFQFNEQMLRLDYKLLTAGRISANISSEVSTSGSDIFIEEGAMVENCNLNATGGPIYIGKTATVMDGCFIRGPFALCEGAVAKMGAKIYGATTIGPYSVAGGEIKNSVLTGYSNKAHDGYLGDSVIGEWCNLGAGTTNSNLKNTAGEVKLWSYAMQEYQPVGIKCGVIMGDYSRTAINTSINTGTVIGICCNVYSSGLTPKFIPDFSWNEKTQIRYKFEKALQDIYNWKKLKNKTLSEQETHVLKHIFDLGDGPVGQN